MTVARRGYPQHWAMVGGPDGGTVLAAALAQDAAHTAFAATEVGIYRSRLNAGSEWNWERLTDLPGGATALALSPDFSADRTLIAGTSIGPFVSFDGGESWRQSYVPRASSHVLALAVSPHFVEDGIAFAGTLEDGIFVSTDRGATWAAWNFGLYDLEVLALAVSPNFARDEMVLAGTSSSLFYSYNGGRAWRELAFPMDAHPILSLAISPTYAQDGMIFAGTEQAGAFQSKDRGQSWESLRSKLGAMCVNAIAFESQPARVFVAGEDALYMTNDCGEQWESFLPVPGILCVAVNEASGLVGVGFEGEPTLAPLTTRKLAVKLGSDS